MESNVCAVRKEFLSPHTAPPMEFHVRDLHSNLTLCGNDHKMKLELKKQFLFQASCSQSQKVYESG